MNPCYKTKKPKWIYVHEIVFAQTKTPWYFLQMMQFQHLHSFMPMKIPSFYGARCDIRILLSFPRFRGVAEKPLCSDQISVEIGQKKRPKMAKVVGPEPIAMLSREGRGVFHRKHDLFGR